MMLKRSLNALRVFVSKPNFVGLTLSSSALDRIPHGLPGAYLCPGNDRQLGASSRRSRVDYKSINNGKPKEVVT